MERVVEMDALQKLKSKTSSMKVLRNLKAAFTLPLFAPCVIFMLPVALLVFLFSSPLLGQEQKPRFQYSIVPIDSLFDHAPPSKVSRLMAYYTPEMERRMNTVVGNAPKEMRAFRPQSPLSNFAADALLAVASELTGEQIDFSLTNFGGLRASIPQGEVRLYDIYAVFPFENALVILEMEGKGVEGLFKNFAQQNRMEAVGNVQVEIEKGKIVEMMIAGSPFDSSKRYKVATIDFLLGGGDNVAALKNAISVIDTGVMIRDVVVRYISMLKKEGKAVEAFVDGRIVVR